jgi:hypothetical protein
MDKLNAHQYFEAVNIFSFTTQVMPDPLSTARITTATIAIDKSPSLFIAINPCHIQLIRECHLAHKSINMKASATTGLIVDVQPLQ